MDRGTYYADQWDGRPFVVGGLRVRAEVPSTSGWAMYKRFMPDMGRHDIVDLYGRPRWLTDAGFLVMLECLRMIAAGIHPTAQQLADAAGCHRSTAARTVWKLTGWGVIAATAVRGKYGRFVLWSREKGDSLEWTAQRARDRAKQAAERRLLRLISKCASIDVRLGDHVATYLVRQVAHLDFTHGRDLAEADRTLFERLGCDPSRPKQRVRCPAHAGEGRNVSWAWGRNGRLLLKCWSHQCTYEEIRKAAL